MDTKYVAKLARVKLNDEEEKIFSKQLSDIVKWVEKLNEIDTSNIKPLFSCTSIENSYFDDIPQDFENKELILKNFPNREFDFVKVKKVI